MPGYQGHGSERSPAAHRPRPTPRGRSRLEPENGLTRRELEVLSLVAGGDTNAAIGLRLAISPRTVQKHLQRTFRKLGVRTRTAAVARVAELLSDSEMRRGPDPARGWLTLREGPDLREAPGGSPARRAGRPS